MLDGTLKSTSAQIVSNGEFFVSTPQNSSVTSGEFCHNRYPLLLHRQCRDSANRYITLHAYPSTTLLYMVKLNMSDTELQPTNGNGNVNVDVDVDSDAKPLTYQQRGAAIRNSGKPSPIVGLPEAEREQLLDYVMVRAYEDKRLRDVAAELGLHRTSLNSALLRYREDAWRDLQVARALVDLEDADIDLDQASDAAAVNRARGKAHVAQFRLERLARRLFGADVSTSSGSSVTINIGALRQGVDVAESDAQVIDAEGSVTG